MQRARSEGKSRLTLLVHERRFLTILRVAHLATADTGAIPHVVPVCFVVCARRGSAPVLWPPTRVFTLDAMECRDCSLANMFDLTSNRLPRLFDCGLKSRRHTLPLFD